jgi:hypothetical protein
LQLHQADRFAADSYVYLNAGMTGGANDGSPWLNALQAAVATGKEQIAAGQQLVVVVVIILRTTDDDEDVNINL